MVNLFKYLRSLEFFGQKLGLTNIKRLMKALGNPHKGLRIIHVAGTNGKGSTCAMISSVLQEAGHTVGVFTSPHLVKVNERFTISGKEISDYKLGKYISRVKDAGIHCTYFEFVTAIALLYFADTNVDYAVLEVGVGGRLDSTNIVTPVLSVITHVAMDHQGYLGNTLKEIAFEKAGIIKKNVPVVTSNKGVALTVIRKKAKEMNAPLTISWKSHEEKYDCGLKGDFQEENATLAALACRMLDVSEKHIVSGLKKTTWKGRFEKIARNVIVDCAHNEDAMKRLVSSLEKLSYDRLILVIGMKKTKKHKKCLKIIAPHASHIVACRAKAIKTLNPQRIVSEIESLGLDVSCEIVLRCSEALSHAKKIAKRRDLVLVAGSVYVVGEVLKFVSLPK